MPAMRYWLAGPGAILMFHEIHQPGDHELRTGVTPAFLDNTLHWMRRNGWDVVSLDEGVRRLSSRQAERRFAVLTFDDGYRDNISLALPVLERHDAPFTIYVPTGAITRTLFSWWLGLRHIFRDNDTVDIEPMGRRFVCASADGKVAALEAVCKWVHQDYRRTAALPAVLQTARLSLEAINDAYFMNAEELTRLSQHPLATIGGHTTSHAAVATLDEPAALEEMSSNRSYLANMLDQNIQHFAFPYGNRNACGRRDFALARKAGFASAVITEDEPLAHAPSELYALPRISVRNDDKLATFDARISGLRKAANGVLRRASS